MESSSAAKTKNDKAWRNVSEEIKRIFRTAVLQLQEKGTMKSTEAKKFLCSGQCQVLKLGFFFLLFLQVRLVSDKSAAEMNRRSRD